jgi:hypothetical protein
MPGRKKIIKSTEIIEDKDESLIAHLPIKLNLKEEDNQTNNEEIEQLKKENKILREKLAFYLNKNKINVIKNQPKNNLEVKCWFCSGNNANLILPEKKSKNQFHGRGKFCSFSCMLSYNFELSDDRVWERYSLIHQMKDEINPTLEKIRPAPPKEVKKEFGGELTNDQYEEFLDRGDDSFIKLIPPLISTQIIIEHRTKPELNDISHLILEETKLKRTKPVNTSRYTLDKLIQLH